MKKTRFGYGSDEEAVVCRLATKKMEVHGAVSEMKSWEEVFSSVAQEERVKEPESVEQEGSLTYETLTRSTSRGEVSEVPP